MRTILRLYLIEVATIYFASRFAEGIVFSSWPESLLLAGLALTGAVFIIKPVLNILLLPLNLITFGLFKWLSFAIGLYLVTLIIPGFKIVGFYFSGFSTKWIDVPAINLDGLLGLLAFSFVLSTISSSLRWLMK